MTTIQSHLGALSFSTPKVASRPLTRGRAIVMALVLDAVILLAALIVAIRVRELPALTAQLGPLADTQWIGPAIVFLWVVALGQFGAYAPRHFEAGATEYKRVVTGSLAAAGIVGIACYLSSVELSRSFFVALFVCGTAGLLITRFVRRQVVHVLHRNGHFRTPVIVAGAPGPVDRIAAVLRRETWLGYEVIGALTSAPGSETPTGLPILGELNSTAELVGRHEADAVIFAEGAFDSPEDFRRMAWELEQCDTQMMVVPNLTDVSADRLDMRPIAGLPLVDIERPQAVEATRWIKRTFDIAGSALLLVLAAPVMLLVAAAIWLEDRGPVFFRQVRVGRSGEEFFCLKFRSMAVDAEARLAELAQHNQGAGVLFKMTNDPRITKVGHFIRRFSLDELPQLWNAFRGDMSLVGPRPALPREVAQYDNDTRRRLEVRPGLTGLWQVSGRSNLSWEDTVRLDLYYVDNWSMVQDLLILAKTARAVAASDGAY